MDCQTKRENLNCQVNECVQLIIVKGENIY